MPDMHYSHMYGKNCITQAISATAFAPVTASASKGVIPSKSPRCPALIQTRSAAITLTSIATGTHRARNHSTSCDATTPGSTTFKTGTTRTATATAMRLTGGSIKATATAAA